MAVRTFYFDSVLKKKKLKAIRRCDKNVKLDSSCEALKFFSEAIECVVIVRVRSKMVEKVRKTFGKAMLVKLSIR